MVWYLKQLTPRTYWTTAIHEDGKPHFHIWNMWLGRCYRVLSFPVVDA